MAQLNEDDDVVINTLNQTEATQKLAAKKEKIKGKNNLKKEKIGAKKLLKDKKTVKSKNVTVAKKAAVVSSQNSGKINMDLEIDGGEEVDLKPKKTWDNPTIQHSASKNAKFSSLFKNNHEIPKIGDLEAKTVKEGLFTKNQFDKLNLSAHLTDCLEKRFRLKKMTQIQEKAIPAIIEGKDCFVKSQTGSGKTLAYAIPIVQQLQSVVPRMKRTDGIRALVLVPTRELAIQTCNVFEQLCNACVWIVAGCLIGGMKKKSEKDRIRRGLNVLVATPGRLCDHLDTTMALDLSKVDYLVFDEADRMLDMDFEKKINFIIFKIQSAKKNAIANPEPPKYMLGPDGEPVEDPSSNLATRKNPQTVLVSATLSKGIKEIARRLNLVDPVTLDASDTVADVRAADLESGENAKGENKDERVALPAGLTHYYMTTPSKLRFVALLSMIMSKITYSTATKPTNKIVIFAATNDSVQFHEDLLITFLNRKFNLYEDGGGDDDSDLDTDFLNKNAPKKDSPNKICDVFALYGNMDQHKRAEILKKYCKATRGVLICTDVAARGIDMPNVDWIIQYNTPGTIVDYVHRVGRTARSGHKGKALIFLEPCEIEYLKELNKIGISLNEIKVESVMDCLNEEAKYYPRQVDGTRLIVARNAEECANSIQFYVEEYVEKSSEVQALSRKAYNSFLRSYSCYSKEWKAIFHIKNLHIGHVAKSFGIREAPNQIAVNSYKSFKTNQERKLELTGRSQNQELKEFEDVEYDKLASKYQRDLKRINNGHREYGNVKKKNILRSQKMELDLSGLLKNHKGVSEFSSGLEENPLFRQGNNFSQKKRTGDVQEPTKPAKMPKKDMRIFD